ncbi:membrane protein insertion efficiency factor YidD [Pseudozobellia thermophila]|uniref:membrane protein insertion efficiency factor YidD n=1 Tax=Pseudozobellia thermophila TaxID=192903 RepID=UPI0009352CAB|nr:membrane protein insertion efficiency factor YidD [Pseudozobellia thermophila]
MRLFLLFSIIMYWITIPKSKRRNCIFHESCSHYVYRITRDNGFYEGLKALLYRYRNCRPEAEVFIHPITGKYQLILPDKTILGQDEIADRLTS